MLDRPAAPSASAGTIAQHTALVDENGLVDQLVDAKPGDRIVYYRGHLAYDRTPSAHVLDAASRLIVPVVANRVMALAEKGAVLPVQKRIGPSDYLYIAVKAQPGRVHSRCAEALPTTAMSNARAGNPPPSMPASLAA